MSKSNLERQFYTHQLYEATLLTQEERDQIAEKVFAEELAQQPQSNKQPELQPSERKLASKEK